MAKEATSPEPGPEIKVDGPENGKVRLIRTDAEGGFLDMTPAEAKELMRVEERCGVKNYELEKK